MLFIEGLLCCEMVGPSVRVERLKPNFELDLFFEMIHVMSLVVGARARAGIGGS